MKDGSILEEVVQRLIMKKHELKNADIPDLKWLLSEADKKLFIGFKEGQLTFD